MVLGKLLTSLGSVFGCLAERFFLRRKKTRPAIRAMKITPPTTPPAIAPVLLDLPELAPAEAVEDEAERPAG